MSINVKRHQTTDFAWAVCDGERYLGEVSYNEWVNYIGHYWHVTSNTKQLVFIGNKYPTLLDAVNAVLAHWGISPLESIQVE